jgi:hypothetical protein
MPPRSIFRSVISFGLVSIRSKFSSHHVKVSALQSASCKDNSRIQEKIYCIAEDKVIDRSELVHVRFRF